MTRYAPFADNRGFPNEFILIDENTEYCAQSIYCNV